MTQKRVPVKSPARCLGSNFALLASRSAPCVRSLTVFDHLARHHQAAAGLWPPARGSVVERRVL